MATIVNVGGGGKNVLEMPKFSFFSGGTLNARPSFYVSNAKRVSFDLSLIQYGAVIIKGYSAEDGSGTGYTIASLSYGATVQNYSYDVSAYKCVSIEASPLGTSQTVNIMLTNIKFYY